MASPPATPGAAIPGPVRASVHSVRTAGHICWSDHVVGIDSRLPANASSSSPATATSPSTARPACATASRSTPPAAVGPPGAGEYDRAARELWGRLPAPSRAGQGLRAASVLLASARFVGRNENKQLLALLAQLAALSDAVMRLRKNQDRAAQAAVARRAAEQLRLTAAQRATV